MAAAPTAQLFRAIQRPLSLAASRSGSAPSLILLAGGVVSLPIAASLREMIPSRSLHHVSSPTVAAAAPVSTVALVDTDVPWFAHLGALGGSASGERR